MDKTEKTKKKKNIALEKDRAGEGARRFSYFEFAAAATIVIAHFLFVMTYYQPAVTTLDAHGYFVQAKQIATTGKSYIIPESKAQFKGHTWRQLEDGRWITPWPPGYPALLAVEYRLFGPETAFLVDPALAALSITALFLVCRALAGPWWGLAAAALMAVNPIFNEYVHFGYSHISVIFFLLWGLLFLLRRDGPRAAIHAFIAGLLLGVIPSIRYPEALFLPAAAFYLLMDPRGVRAGMRSVIPFAAGAAIPIAALLIWNRVIQGDFLETNYSRFGYTFASFKWEYFIKHAVPYLMKLLGESGAFSFALGAAGIAYLCARSETRRAGALLCSLAVPVTLVYMAYYQSPGSESSRFLLPTVPLYTIGCVMLLKALGGRSVAAAAAPAAVILLLAAAWGLPQSIDKMQRLETRKEALVRVTRMLEQHVPPGSVIIAGEALNNHLDVLGRWRIADSVAPADRRNGTDYRTLNQRALYAELERDARDWAGPGGRVFWVVKEGQLSNIARMLPPGSRLTPSARLEMDEFTRRLAQERLSVGSKFIKQTPDSPRMIKGCYNIDPGPATRLDNMLYHFISGPPVVIYEWTR